MYASANTGFTDQSVRPKSSNSFIRPDQRPPLPLSIKSVDNTKSNGITTQVGPSPPLPPSVTNIIIKPIINENIAPVTKLPVQSQHQLEVSKLINDMQNALHNYAHALGRKQLPPSTIKIPHHQRPRTAPHYNPSRSSLGDRKTTSSTQYNNNSASPFDTFASSSSLLGSNGITTTTNVLPPLPLYIKPEPKPIFRPSSSRSTLRPSLSTQLTTIMDQVSLTTQDIKSFQLKLQQNHNKSNHNKSSTNPTGTKEITDDPIVTLPALAMSVGTLISRTGGIVKLYTDRAVYDFSHPYASGAMIEMVMYYRDLQDIYTQNNNKTVVWRVPRSLEIFPNDYNPNSRTHAGKLSIEFLNSTAALTMFKMMHQK